MSGIDRQYMHPGYKKKYPIRTVLRDLAGQEGCDGEPYDAMQFAADTIDALEKALAAAEAREAKLREALEGVVIYGSDTLSGPVPPQRHDLIWARDGIREMVRRARAALIDKGDTDNDG